MNRFACIHGHFYQPPRENPWLEAVEVQDSAEPYHDWNARVSAECYGPNSAARLLDDEGRILEITNNFEHISFDVGPTLLSWLEDFQPELYGAILEADKRSLSRYGGHGNAIAQAYNHPILPLCSWRDLSTQVRWGIRDFEVRFGRPPEGMWLPECAVNTPTLEELTAQGIAFTVLAPHQAARVRRGGSGAWTDVEDSHLDSSRAYRCRLPSGRSIVLFFYNGPLAQDVAFGGLPKSGEEFLERMLSGFSRRKRRAQLLHLATDGETYGHHIPFGEMSLAYVLKRLGELPEVAVTNYATFLEISPPRYEAEIVENSSWSCYHGIERWRGDCGCSTDPSRGWHQRWRLPLREALDGLREAAAELYENEAKGLMKEPWEAREGYIDVVLDRSEDSIERFFAKHQERPLEEAEKVRALKLLEMQRHSMLMYTSCGWFFDEVSGLESTKVLEYAAQVVLLGKTFGTDWEGPFLRALEKAPSNLASFGSASGVYEKLVRPAMVDLPRVVAHHAISRTFEEPQPEKTIYCYTIREEDRGSLDMGPSQLALGRVTASSDITHEAWPAVYGVVYMGGYDFHCSVASAESIEDYEGLKTTLLEQCEREGLTEVIRTLDDIFGRDYYTLKDLFIEKRRELLELLTEQVVAKFDSTYRALFEENRRLMAYLQEANAPLVPGFRGAARYALEQELIQAMETFEAAGQEEAIDSVLAEATRWGVSIATEPVAKQVEEALEEAMDVLEEELSSATLDKPLQLLALADRLGVTPSLWSIQNRFWRLAHSTLPKLKDGPQQGELLEAALKLGERINFNRGALSL